MLGDDLEWSDTRAPIPFDYGIYLINHPGHLLNLDLEGGCLFEAEHLLTFSAFRMGRLFEVGTNSRLDAYSSNKYGKF